MFWTRHDGKPELYDTEKRRLVQLEARKKRAARPQRKTRPLNDISQEHTYGELSEDNHKTQKQIKAQNSVFIICFFNYICHINILITYSVRS